MKTVSPWDLDHLRQAQFAFGELNELHGEPQRMLFISGVLLVGDRGSTFGTAVGQRNVSDCWLPHRFSNLRNMRKVLPLGRSVQDNGCSYIIRSTPQKKAEANHAFFLNPPFSARDQVIVTTIALQRLHPEGKDERLPLLVGSAQRKYPEKHGGAEPP